MFLDEARIAARIRHMHVVPTLDISDSPGDGYFLVMEYIEGSHLGALLGRAAKRGERLPQPFVARVLIDALQGLGAAHRLTDERGTPLKLVHRDVSPHNILVGTDGIARLTDFGVAKADVRMATTRAGQFKGKLSYMAPEQASSNSTDQRSDLFSLGIILWESLTGRRLFKGESNAATLNKLLNDTVAKPSELWPDVERFDDVVMKALRRNPDDRFQSAEEFGEALESAAGRAGVAKTRDVADVVRFLDAEKLQDERSRVRDAIKVLGSSEIDRAGIPMPREGTPTDSRTYDLPGSTGSHSRGSASGILRDGTPVIVRARSESDALKWFVMALAIIVLLYASFLVWQLLRPPVAKEPARRQSPAAAVESAAPSEAESGAPSEGPAADPTGTKADAANTSTTPKSRKQVKRAPERTNSTAAPRSTRRRSRTAAKPEPVAAEEPEKPTKMERSRPPARAPKADPVDIDIDNPYRN